MSLAMLSEPSRHFVRFVMTNMDRTDPGQILKFIERCTDKINALIKDIGVSAPKLIFKGYAGKNGFQDELAQLKQDIMRKESKERLFINQDLKPTELEEHLATARSFLKRHEENVKKMESDTTELEKLRYYLSVEKAKNLVLNLEKKVADETELRTQTFLKNLQRGFTLELSDLNGEHIQNWLKVVKNFTM